MISNKSAYKKENPYKGPLEIIQMWTNGIVTLKMGPKTVIYNMHSIKPYKPKTDVEDFHT